MRIERSKPAPYRFRSRAPYSKAEEPKSDDKGLKRFFYEQLIRLGVFGIPLAALAIIANSQIAVFNAKARNAEYVRDSWETLQTNLEIRADEYLDSLAQTIDDYAKDKYDNEIPVIAELGSLNRILSRISLYGENHHRNREAFIQYCDHASEWLVYAEGTKRAIAAAYQELDIRPETASTDLVDVLSSSVLDYSEEDWFKYEVAEIAQADLRKGYTGLSQSIDTLLLMITDPEYRPPELTGSPLEIIPKRRQQLNEFRQEHD